MRREENKHRQNDEQLSARDSSPMREERRRRRPHHPSHTHMKRENKPHFMLLFHGNLFFKKSGEYSH